MNVARRSKKLKALLNIRLGPGAAVLSSDVKRIHLDFARKINDGHFGARKVWRLYLPRLKYHNPAISMTVNRTVDQVGPAVLKVFFGSSSGDISTLAAPLPSSTTDPSAAPSKEHIAVRVEKIDMKHRNESEILSQLLALTGALPYDADPEELAGQREVEDYERNSQRDRDAQAKLNEVRRQEQALFDQARGAAVDAA